MRANLNTAIIAAVMVLGLIFIGTQNAYAQDAYSVGYNYGRQDRQSNLSNDFKRHRNQYNNSTKKDFKNGYRDGFRDGANSNWGNIWQPGNPNWGQGQGTSRPPNWMIGTFRGYTPSSGTYTRITINPNGYINISAENGTYNGGGYFSNGRVNFEWGQYRFQREGNGFRSINLSNRADRVYYQRIR